MIGDQTRLKVLHICPSFFTAIYWGGPTYSTYGLCNSLASLDEVNLVVLTTDSAGKSLKDRVNAEERPVRTERGYSIYYCRRIAAVSVSPELLRRLPRLVCWADIIHLNAVYSFPTIPALAMARALGRPVVWSPRGALQRWGGTRSRMAKFLWESLCRALLIPEHTVLHVTSELEAAASIKRLRGLRAVKIVNGVDIPEEPAQRRWLPNGKLRILFLGRLDPIKAIDNLLKALANIPSNAAILEICGAGSPDYEGYLRGLVRSLGIESQVIFTGPVSASGKSDAYSRADVSVVPSHSENFGLVVAESLAHGIPVIASRGTPWEELRARGCGLWVENTPASLANAIDHIGELDLESMGARGRAWMQAEFRWDVIARQMRELYDQLMHMPK